MSIFQIRNGYKGYVNRVSASMKQSTANSTTTVYLMTKNFGEVWRVRRVIYLNNSGNSQQSIEIYPPIEIPSKCTVKIQAYNVSNDNTGVEGEFDLTLIQD